jgi:Tfp pilus assembly protein PilN
MKAVNLIPSDQRGGGGNLAGSSEGGAFIVLGLMAGLAVLALLYGVAHHQISSRGSKAAALSAEAATSQAEAARLAPYTSFVAMRNERQKAISELVEARFDWAHAFHELGRVLPFDVSLSSVKGTTGTGTTGAAPAAAAPAASGTASSATSAVSSATPAGTAPTFTLVGCATSQSEVAQMLTRLRLADGVTNVELQSSTKPESNASSGSTGCPSENDPGFTVQVTFAALPTAAAQSAALPAEKAATVAAAGSKGKTSTSTTAAPAAKGGS